MLIKEKMNENEIQWNEMKWSEWNVLKILSVIFFSLFYVIKIQLLITNLRWWLMSMLNIIKKSEKDLCECQ